MPKFTRVALEGATIDGRKISKKQIQEMSDQYDPDKKHGARIWLEHFRNLFAEGPFPALGDVLTLKTQEVDVDGKKKLGLYAQLQPTEKLLKMNQDKQKVYTSIEIDDDYAGTGKAYLTGLAVTDSPSSTGNQMLAFSQKQNFKELEGKSFSEYIETELELIDKEPKEKFTAKIKALFTKKQASDDDRFSEHEESITLVAKELESTQNEYKQLQKDHKDLGNRFSKMETDLDELKTFKTHVEKHSTNKPVPKSKGGTEAGTRKKGFF